MIPVLERRQRQRLHAAVRRRRRPAHGPAPRRRPDRQRQPRPRAHGARDRRGDQRHQPHRRRRRARRGRLRDLGGDPGDHRAVARPPRAPGCSPRSPRAARSASCATASRPRPASWATRARTCSATCSPAIAVQGALKTNAVVALFFPLIVLAVPILDTGFVIAKRIKYRRPIYGADRWHFHHRMANIGFSQRRTLAYLYGWALVMAGLALALRFVPYSDDHGHFDPAWTVVIGVCWWRRSRRASTSWSCSRSSSCAGALPRARRQPRRRARRGRGRRGRRPRARDRAASRPSTPTRASSRLLDPRHGERPP